MHYPRLRADVRHRGEVGLHESSEVGSSLLVREFPIGESMICEYDCLLIDQIIVQGCPPAIIVWMEARIKTSALFIRTKRFIILLTSIHLCQNVRHNAPLLPSYQELTKVFISRVTAFATVVFVQSCPDALKVRVPLEQRSAVRRIDDTKRERQQAGQPQKHCPTMKTVWAMT